MIDIREFEEIVESTSSPLYKYCFLKLDGDESLTEETVGDVYRILFEKWDTVRGDEDRGSRLYRIADDCIRKVKKDADRRGSFCHEEHRIDSDRELLWYDEYFADDTAETELVDLVRDSLPEEYRDLFDMKFLSGLTINEIAAERGLSYSTARLRLLRMERLVRSELRRLTAKE